jgi:gas vesicle protein
MEKNNNHRGPSFMNGFFLGIIIGAAIVFLIGTKKGKKVLKLLTESGIEGVSDLQEMLSETGDADEYEQEYSADGEEIEQIMHEPQQEKPVTRPLKRFFRGIKKIHSN